MESVCLRWRMQSWWSRIPKNAGAASSAAKLRWKRTKFKIKQVHHIADGRTGSKHDRYFLTTYVHSRMKMERDPQKSIRAICQKLSESRISTGIKFKRYQRLQAIPVKLLPVSKSRKHAKSFWKLSHNRCSAKVSLQVRMVRNQQIR